MSRMYTALGALVVAIGALTGGVEAKTIFYEINGQRYSYDPNNRQQTKAARQQIHAAKAAETAQAKAAVERASNPLVTIFGSQAQREAAAAQAQLEKIIADQQQVATARKGQRAAATAKDDRVAKSADEKVEETTGIVHREQTAAMALTAAHSPSARAAPDVLGSIEPVKPDTPSKAAIKSISLDAETGIKTVFRVDGSIHEELFDPSVLSKLDSDQHSARVVSGGPDAAQPHKDLLDDTTGFTGLPRTTLGLNTGADTRGGLLAN